MSGPGADSAGLPNTGRAQDPRKVGKTQTQSPLGMTGQRRHTQCKTTCVQREAHGSHTGARPPPRGKTSDEPQCQAVEERVLPPALAGPPRAQQRVEDESRGPRWPRRGRAPVTARLPASPLAGDVDTRPRRPSPFFTPPCRTTARARPAARACARCWDRCPQVPGSHSVMIVPDLREAPTPAPARALRQLPPRQAEVTTHAPDPAPTGIPGNGPTRANFFQTLSLDSKSQCRGGRGGDH